MIPSRFIPCDDNEESPARIDTLSHVETPKRVELSELPIGTIVQFYGMHPDSKYICKIVGSEEEKRIKIWFKGNFPGAIASLEDIVSGDIFKREHGVMEIGQNYVLPHFYYQSIKTSQQKLIINTEQRTEHYTKIFIKKP